MNKVKKECNCEDCRLPALEYSGGQIIIYNEHHGKKHINHIPVDWVIDRAINDGLGKQIMEKLKGE
ncbi:MAG: hypothetical protein LC768_13615 [Acidobacteria bacterium]|nr:hypothetical protein [Acidobacteriota bacterium]MCA1639348.1 hypothetical protein [Acidobacteriota bacterium]